MQLYPRININWLTLNFTTMLRNTKGVTAEAKWNNCEKLQTFTSAQQSLWHEIEWK